MTVPAPYSVSVVSGWQVVDWLDRVARSAPADADGVATITLDTLPDNQRWQLTHVVAGATTTATPQMRLYLDDTSVSNLRDGTSAGAFDVADWPMGLMVPPGRALVASWTGCNPGDVAYINIQANILQRSS